MSEQEKEISIEPKVEQNATKLPNNEDISDETALAYMKELLPEGSDASLYESDTCLFCQSEPKERSCYAIVDMGHEEPASKKRNLIGKRVKTQIGSIAPLQISCCKSCKSHYRTLYWLGVLVPVVFVAIVLGVLLIPAVYTALGGITSVAPLLIFIASLPLGWYIGKLVTSQYKKKKASQTKLNPLDIPYLQKMIEKGWFPITASAKGDVQVIFSNQLRQYGLLSLEVSEKNKKSS